MSFELAWTEPRGTRVRLKAPVVRINWKFVRPVIHAASIVFCIFFVTLQIIYRDTFPYFVAIAGGIFATYLLCFVVFYWGARLLGGGFYRLIPRTVRIQQSKITIASILDKPRHIKIEDIGDAWIEYQGLNRRILFFKSNRGESCVGIAPDIQDSQLNELLGRQLEVRRRGINTEPEK